MLENKQIKEAQQQQLTQLQQVGDSKTKQLEDYKAQVVRLEQCEQQEAQTKQLEDYKVKVAKLARQCEQQETKTKQLEDYKKQTLELSNNFRDVIIVRSYWMKNSLKPKHKLN